MYCLEKGCNSMTNICNIVLTLCAIYFKPWQLIICQWCYVIITNDGKDILFSKAYDGIW